MSSKNNDLVDAQEMHNLYPDTFDAPSRDDLDAISPGDTVKVSRNLERFLVAVTLINGENITGKVDNDLFLQKDISCGSVITLRKRHVHDIWPKQAE